MANLLQSTQVKSTCAPGFYTDYLSNLASRGQAAQQQAQYVGAQPLQEKAFKTVEENLAAQQPTFEAGKGYLGRAAEQDITGAAAPYLQAATAVSPLCAARPMICQAANLNIACLAGQYMSPYLQKAMQSVSDIGQRNIRQNLSPMATAAAVGSGQFGSQRGAQVLGQIQEQAQQDINKQLAEMANTGYAQALQAAQAKQNALTQAASEITRAAQAGSDIGVRAAGVAGCAAAKEAGALERAGTGMGTIAQQASGVNLACINALSTLGGQQQTIKQNEQNYPLTTLASLASLLQGYSIPTATRTQLQMSPLSAIGTIGAGALGFLLPKTDSSGNPISGSSQLDQIIKLIKGSPSSTGTGSGLEGLSCANVGRDEQKAIDDYLAQWKQMQEPTISPTGQTIEDLPQCADGGSVQKKATGGHVGCASTKSRGGLPYKKG